jgi:hypothetical protein
MFGIQNKTTFVMWLTINTIGVIFLYNLCSSHASVEKKNFLSRLFLNYFERREYNRRVFCSAPLPVLVTLAILFTFALNANRFQNYALGLFFVITIFIFNFK